MDDTIKTMIEALKQYNAGYIKVGLGEYSVIVADKETTEFIDRALDAEDEEYQEMLDETDDFI